MIELLCLAFTLTVTTAGNESHVKLKQQECIDAKDYCQIVEDDWELKPNPLLNGYLTAKWQMTTQRKQVEISDIACESNIMRQSYGES